jgi:hypothetical protein
LFGREPTASVLVSETRLLLPGIVKEEIGQKLSLPSERMFANSVLKVAAAARPNGTSATIRDNLTHITITEQFMELVTQVSKEMRRLPKQSKPYWIMMSTCLTRTPDHLHTENVARASIQQQILISLRQPLKPVFNGIVVLITTASPLAEPIQAAVEIRIRHTNSPKWCGKEMPIRKLDLVSRKIKLSLGIARLEMNQRHPQTSRTMFVRQDAQNGALLAL